MACYRDGVAFGIIAFSFVSLPSFADEGIPTPEELKKMGARVTIKNSDGNNDIRAVPMTIEELKKLKISNELANSIATAQRPPEPPREDKEKPVKPESALDRAGDSIREPLPAAASEPSPPAQWPASWVVETIPPGGKVPDAPALTPEGGAPPANPLSGADAIRPRTVLDANEGGASEDLMGGTGTHHIGWSAPAAEALPQPAPVLVLDGAQVRAPAIGQSTQLQLPPALREVRAALDEQVLEGNLAPRLADRLMERLAPLAGRLEEMQADPERLRALIGEQFRILLAEENNARPVGAPGRIVVQGGNAQALGGNVELRASVPSPEAAPQAAPSAAASPAVALLYSPPGKSVGGETALEPSEVLDPRLPPFEQAFATLGKTLSPRSRDRAAGPGYGAAVDVATGEARRGDGAAGPRGAAPGARITLREQPSFLRRVIAKLTSLFRPSAGAREGAEVAEAAAPGSGLKAPRPGALKVTRGLASLAGPRQATAVETGEAGGDWLSWGAGATFCSLVVVALEQWRRNRRARS